MPTDIDDLIRYLPPIEGKVYGWVKQQSPCLHLGAKYVSSALQRLKRKGLVKYDAEKSRWDVL